MSSTRPYFEAVARQAGAMPQARYVLPQFEERTAYRKSTRLNYSHIGSGGMPAYG